MPEQMQQPMPQQPQQMAEGGLAELDIPEGPAIIDLQLPSGALITPKTEMNRFIHDQFPYIIDESISNLPFDYPDRPSGL
jgi:hypothetical protein